MISTNILHDRAFPLSRFDFFNSVTDTVDYETITQAYYELYQANYQRNNMLDPAVLDDMTQWENLRGRVPILILDYLYNKLDTLAIQDNLLTYQNGFLYDVPGRSRSPYFTQHLQMAFPLVEEVKSNTVTFMLIPHFVSRNTGLNVQQVTMDFGTGPQTLNGALDSLTITFQSSGIKTGSITVLLSNGNSFSSNIKFLIGGNNIEIGGRVQAPPHCGKELLPSNYPFQGYDETQAFTGLFEVNYYYRSGIPCNGNFQNLAKPIILIDGYDPTDKRDAPTLIDKFLFYIDDVNYPYNPPTQVTTQYMLDEMRALGYDVIIVNIPTYFHTYGGQIIPLPPNANNPPSGYTYQMGKIIRGGGDYVERNARTLVTLIEKINQQLAQQGSTEKLIIIGPSMGGQISRYALKWMEDQGKNHNCKLWVSFDSNHGGAIIPIGEQFFINYASGLVSSIRRSRERQLDVPAAKQFLVDHYLHHTPTSPYVVGGAPGFFDMYKQVMDDLGWPQQCRKISLISGAENGNALPIPQAEELALGADFLLGRGGFLFSVICDLFSSGNCRLLEAKMFTAPGPGAIGKVGEIKIPIANINKSWFIRGSDLTRSQSLEAVQGGYYWGYQELVHTAPGGISGGLGGKLLKKIINLNMPAGYHTHHLTGGDLAYGKGRNGSLYNFKLDDDVTPYSLDCEGYIPFDYYFGPKYFSVRHDSLFYWQARILIEEIQGIYHDNKKDRTWVVNCQYPTALWCPGQTNTFNVVNPPTNISFIWTTNHPQLEIINGQGTSEITVRYNYTPNPHPYYIITANGEGDCYRYTGSNQQGGVLVDPELLVGGYSVNNQIFELWFNNVNTVSEATTAIVNIGSYGNQTMYGLTNVNYTLLNNPPIAYTWQFSTDPKNYGLIVTAEPTQDRNNALWFRVSYSNSCDGLPRSADFALFFYDNRVRVNNSGTTVMEGNNLIISTPFTKNGQFEIYEVQIFDMGGKLVRKTSATINNGRIYVNVIGVANGVYAVRVRTKNGIITQKAFINR